AAGGGRPLPGPAPLLPLRRGHRPPPPRPRRRAPDRRRPPPDPAPRRGGRRAAGPPAAAGGAAPFGRRSLARPRSRALHRRGERRQPGERRPLLYPTGGPCRGAAHPVPRPAAHPRDVAARGRAAGQGGLGAAGPRPRQRHARHLRPRPAGHAGARRRGVRVAPLRPRLV
ncbi:MAG: Phage integrase, site-specific tyrosine recombinase, partial [uncultured Thermomicrobiales bacterium]